MTMRVNGPTIRDLGHLFEGESVAGLGEVQLLERFVARRDEPAFAALVSRHGPMVWSVCRRFLSDPLDVEDAFQATFLVLVRRAGSIQDRDRLAPWLFGVARKVATRARLDRSKRRTRERPGLDDQTEPSAFDPVHDELGQALIEEIDRLPDSLRRTVLLCCVEGLSYEQAADRMGGTAAAIRGRLARARERLRSRLTHRGFAPTAGAVALMLAAETVSAAVPHPLVISTTRAAMGFAAGNSATAGLVPVAVASLADGVLSTMTISKWKVAAMTLMTFGVVGSSVGVFGQQPGPDALPQPQPQGQVLSAHASDSRLSGVEQKLDRLIEVLERQNALNFGQPMARAPLQGGHIEPPMTVEPPMPAEPPRTPTQTSSGVGKLSQFTTVFRAEPQAASNTSNRLNAVEEKMGRLEARLLEIERRLEIAPRSSDAPAVGPDQRPVGIRRDAPINSPR